MLDIQYTKEGLKDLNYVVINIKPKKGDDPHIKGLLLGIRSLDHTGEDNPELFVWVYRDKTVFILALRYYSISSLEVCIDEKTMKSQFIYFEETQSLTAVAKIYVIQKVLGDQDRIKQNGLIDVSTYRHLPEYLTKMIGDDNIVGGKQEKDNTAGTNSRATSAAGINHNRSSTYTPYVAKTVTTFVIERATKYSIEEAILAMGDKVREMRAKTYQPPILKKIPADDIEEKGEETKIGKHVGYKAVGNNTEDIDEWEKQYGMYG